MKLRIPSNDATLRIACVMALLALPLMVWSVFDPTVWPIMVALSVGQALGTLSFFAFLVVVARDLRIRRKLRIQAATDAASLPPPSVSEPPESKG